MKLDKVTRLFLFTLIALALYWLDDRIILPGATPDAGLGLSLTVTIFAVWTCSVREGALVTAVWFFLGMLICSGFEGFLFTACGLLPAFLVIAALRLVLGENQVWIAGCLGALTNGLGQLFALIGFTKTPSYLLFFPMIICYSIFAGLLIGLCAQLVIKRGSEKWKTIFK